MKYSELSQTRVPEQQLAVDTMAPRSLWQHARSTIPQSSMHSSMLAAHRVSSVHTQRLQHNIQVVPLAPMHPAGISMWKHRVHIRL